MISLDYTLRGGLRTAFFFFRESSAFPPFSEGSPALPAPPCSKRRLRAGEFRGALLRRWEEVAAGVVGHLHGAVAHELLDPLRNEGLLDDPGRIEVPQGGGARVRAGTSAQTFCRVVRCTGCPAPFAKGVRTEKGRFRHNQCQSGHGGGIGFNELESFTGSGSRRFGDFWSSFLVRRIAPWRHTLIRSLHHF